MVKFVSNFKSYTFISNLKWFYNPIFSDYQLLMNYRSPKFNAADDFYTHIDDFEMNNAMFYNVDCYDCT